MQSAACAVCNKAGHPSTKCPELTAPLKPGFFSGGGGGRPSGDDEDEHIRQDIRIRPRDCKSAQEHTITV
jgi:hypothetical protein